MDTHQMTLQIRKLRKKLRQIENLESLERDLTDEEISKCLKKDNLREELLFLLSQFNEAEISSKVEEDFNSSCSLSTDWSVSTSQSVSESDISVKVSQTELNTETPSGPNNEGAKRQDSSAQLKTAQKQSVNTQSQNVAEKKEEASTRDLSPTKKIKPTKQNTKTQQNMKTVFWDTSGFIVNVLEGHNDLVTAVDCNGPLFVSASRDTTIKVWDFKTLKEQKSLGSHTGSVTDVVLLSGKELGSIGPQLGLSEDGFLVLSGSVDCSLKLWSASTGELLKSMYTYNPITKVAFYPGLECAVTGSDGGKLELWDLDTKDNITSNMAHNEAITGLMVKDGKIFTSCAVEGEIKVFEVRDKTLVCVFASENLHLSDGKPVTLRHIRSLSAKGDNLYYGDDGVNLKVLTWKKGLVKKVPNHKEDFGMTDAICIKSDTMITSAFDLDTGSGYLNVFDVVEEPLYVDSIHSEESGRILDIACSYDDGKYVTIVTAGTELQVWKQVPNSGKNKDLISTKFEPKLSHSAVDSDIESDVEFSDSDSEDAPPGSRRGSTQTNTTSSWMSWCNLL